MPGKRPQLPTSRMMRTVQHWMVALGLWPRMALGISLGFLVLFGAFSALGERALHDSTERLLEERLVIAEMAAGQIDRLLQQGVSELEQARRFAAFDPASPDLSAEATLLAQTYGQVGTFASGITFLDTQGRVVLSYPPGLSPSGTDLSTLPHVAEALARREVTVSAPFRDALSNRPVVAVTVPIYDANRFLGLLSGLIDLNGPAVVAPLNQAAASGHTSHALLVDSQGRTLASTLHLAFLTPGEHASFYRRAIAQGQPVVATVPFELDRPGEPKGHPHVMAFAPLRMAPFGVAVGGDVDETFAGVQRLRLGLALLTAISLAVVWIATLVGTQRLVRPVQRLTESAQRIAAGDLHTPLQAPEGGEIGAMASALESMRAQLLANISELATWNETLEARVGERTEALRHEQALTQQLLRRAITAQEEERARLSRELHDEIGQTLTAVQLSLDRLSRALPAADMSARERLDRTRTLTEQTLADLRRVIAALRPGVLDQLGLVPALGWVADHTLRPLGLQVNIETNGLQGRLPGEIETILFRIAQEAMSNAVRHGKADHLTIRLERINGQAMMTLSDDGVGFDPSTVVAAPDQSRGLGLAGMQERASLAGGQVVVESAPGRGTAVRVVVPLSAVIE
ncbi:MAG: cache domain-containing protein [Ardenticatenaceae bacterium]|nr:cache domain-containing protein [Ardenticatenaceae bacterium]